MKKILQLSLVFLVTTTALAQVQFKVEWLESKELYKVSLVSSETWGSPNNITSTAQVSVKVPMGGFELSDIVNLQDDVVFELNGIHRSPEESPEFDYISFGLKSMGTHGLHYVEGEPVELFTFRNSGSCTGPVLLLDQEDTFLPPNSANANVGNQITVFGAQGNAYMGNVGDGKADCSLTGTTESDRLKTSFNIYPNPAQEEINLRFEWTGPAQEMTLILYDIYGKKVLSKEVGFTNGKNNHLLKIDGLRSGTYSLEVQNEGFKTALGQLVKL